jgi:hypothetical protein
MVVGPATVPAQLRAEKSRPRQDTTTAMRGVPVADAPDWLPAGPARRAAQPLLNDC